MPVALDEMGTRETSPRRELNSNLGEPSVSGNETWDEDDAPVCRICRMIAEDGKPLLHPCKCSGSIKFVHEPCLLQWLNHSGKKSCELCGYHFSFTSVYSEDAPQELPFALLLFGILMKGLNALKYVYRVFVVWMAWMVVLPVCTCLMWRIAFLSSWEQVGTVVGARLGSLALSLDCFQGSLLTAGLGILMMLFAYARDRYESWSLRLEEHFEQKLQELTELTAASTQLPSDRPPNRVPPSSQSDSDLGSTRGLDGSVETSEDFHDADDTWNGPNASHNGRNAARRQNTVTTAVLGRLLGVLRSMGLNTDTLVQQFQTWEVRVNAWTRHFEAHLNHFEELVYERLYNWGEKVQELLQQWEERIHNHLDRIEERVEERLNEFDQPLGRVIGLRGPIHNILLNVAAVVVFFGWLIFLCVWCPLKLGWLTSSVIQSVLKGGVHMIAFVFLPILDLFPGWTLLLTAVKGVNVDPQIQSEPTPQTTESMVDMGCPALTFERVAFYEQSPVSLERTPPLQPVQSYFSKIVSELEGHVIPPTGSELMSLSVGWTVILSTVFMGFWVRSAWHVWARNGRGHTQETGVFFLSWMLHTLKGIVVGVKMMVMLALELFVFPTGFGYWAHLCMSPLFRMSGFNKYTFLALSFHWFCGMGFLLGFTSLVRLLREVLRPGALPFLKDPTRPERDPFTEMATEPLPKQIFNFSMSCVIYSLLGVLILHIPSRIARFMCTQMHPLKSVFKPLPVLQLPLDVLLFNMVLPFVLEQLKRGTMKEFIQTWLRWASFCVGLEEYLLPEDQYIRVELGRWTRRWQAQRTAGIKNWIFRKFGLETGERTRPTQSEEETPSILREGYPVGAPIWDPASHGHTLDDPADAAVNGDAARGNNNEDGRNAEGAVQRGTEELEAEPWFETKMICLLVLWASTMVVCYTAMLVTPVAIGRVVCGRILGMSWPIPRYDLFTAYVGVLSVCTCIEIGRGVVNVGAREDVRNAVNDGVHVVVCSLRVATFLVLWLGMTAMLLGSFFEMVLRPIKMLTDGTDARVDLMRIWSTGVVCLMIWHLRLSTWQRMNPDTPFQNPLYVELAAVHQRGVGNIRLKRAITHLIIPLTFRLVGALLGPWVATKALQYGDFLSTKICNVIELHAHFCLFMAYVGFKCTGQLEQVIHDLENTIRDDQYLVRQELNNFYG